MSILINLLPDIRQAKLREGRRRQLVTGVSVSIWVVCGGLLVLLSIYEGGQKIIISRDSNTINQKEQTLRAVPNLLSAYTAEEHLASLPSLYGQRVYITKFLQAYSASDPTAVTLNSLQVDAQNNLTIEGTGQTYAAVAKLARALADSNVTVGTGASPTNMPYFSNVQIGQLDYTPGQGVTFTLSAILSSGVVSNGNQ